MQFNTSPCKSTQIYASQHKSIQVSTSPCKSTHVHTSQQKSMQINASPCKSTQVHASQHKSMQVNTSPYKSTQVHASQHKSMQVNTRSRKIINPNIYGGVLEVHVFQAWNRVRVWGIGRHTLTKSVKLTVLFKYSITFTNTHQQTVNIKTPKHTRRHSPYTKCNPVHTISNNFGNPNLSTHTIDYVFNTMEHLNSTINLTDFCNNVINNNNHINQEHLDQLATFLDNPNIVLIRADW